jgi:hypothetical protein
MPLVVVGSTDEEPLEEQESLDVPHTTDRTEADNTLASLPM